MEFFALAGISVGLAMDAFAISVTEGMSLRRVRVSQAAAIALTFGFFQFLMPLLGFFFGMLFYQAIQAFDHWVVLILLVFLGGKMLVEGIRSGRAARNSPEAPPSAKTTLSAKTLLMQALATSIDALAVGVSLAVMNADIFFCAPVIGIITSLICFPAVFIGKRIGGFLGNKAEVFGGLILIAIGIRVFAQHISG